MQDETIVKFISLITSVTVAECTRHSFNPAKDHINTFSEKVAAKIAAECRKPVANDEEPSPVQQLRVDLKLMFDNIRQELIEEIKDSVRMGIMMELDMELGDIKAQLSKEVCSLTPSSSKPQAVVNQRFNTGITMGTASNVGKSVSSNPTGDKKCDVNLQSNPLFMRVTQNLERNQQGKASYSTEDFINARGDRFDDEHREMMRQTAKTLKAEFDDESSEEDDRWTRMGQIMKDRLS